MYIGTVVLTDILIKLESRRYGGVNNAIKLQNFFYVYHHLPVSVIV